MTTIVEKLPENCCGNCPGIFPGIELPEDNTTFCGTAIPDGKRFVCAFEIQRGDFRKHPKFHAAADMPDDCPMCGGRRA